MRLTREKAEIEKIEEKKESVEVIKRYKEEEKEKRKRKRKRGKEKGRDREEKEKEEERGKKGNNTVVNNVLN